jgi:hypothetical protein
MPRTLHSPEYASRLRKNQLIAEPLEVNCRDEYPVAMAAPSS